MGLTGWFVFGVALLVGALLPAHGAVATTRICVGGAVVIQYDDPQDAELGCAGARASLEFLAALDIQRATPVQLDFSDQVMLDLGGYRFQVLGHYDSASDRIRMSSYDAHARLQAEAPTFPIAFGSAFHRSVIAHEAAHAIIDEHFADDLPPVTAHEYVAYVVQFATMPRALRDAILGHYPHEGFAAASEMHPMLYAMGPDVFAIKSWRHHQQAGAAFMHGLFDGSIKPPGGEAF